MAAVPAVAGSYSQPAGVSLFPFFRWFFLFPTHIPGCPAFLRCDCVVVRFCPRYNWLVSCINAQSIQLDAALPNCSWERLLANQREGSGTILANHSKVIGVCWNTGGKTNWRPPRCCCDSSVGSDISTNRHGIECKCEGDRSCGISLQFFWPYSNK